ncbi:hypothetical protein [Colwellia psychrerythraea]|uniref:HTH cro/C1-type domain-containing protein n=1 Tax=Colwellia psychrerythraea TaxID=28229 RepID=A0A099L6R6_COLPS|nr:hypothetical protein [Colwellia psychrerythraea]KGJ97578.1 hypothetical protein GAB14E_1167 [Colwellia psychrerythraea]
MSIEKEMAVAMAQRGVSKVNIARVIGKSRQAITAWVKDIDVDLNLIKTMALQAVAVEGSTND